MLFTFSSLYVINAAVIRFLFFANDRITAAYVNWFLLFALGKIYNFHLISSLRALLFTFSSLCVVTAADIRFFFYTKDRITAAYVN